LRNSAVAGATADAAVTETRVAEAAVAERPVHEGTDGDIFFHRPGATRDPLGALLDVARRGRPGVARRLLCGQGLRGGEHDRARSARERAEQPLQETTAFGVRHGRARQCVGK
jgi:hypothetical protein